MNAQRWTRDVGLVLAVAAGALTACPALAHHSSAPFYDATKKVEAQGPVTKFLFKNPHSFLYFRGDRRQGTESRVADRARRGGVADPHRLDARDAQAGHGDQGCRAAVAR